MWWILTEVGDGEEEAAVSGPRLTKHLPLHTSLVLGAGHEDVQVILQVSEGVRVAVRQVVGVIGIGELLRSVHSPVSEYDHCIRNKYFPIIW